MLIALVTVACSAQPKTNTAPVAAPATSAPAAAGKPAACVQAGAVPAWLAGRAMPLQSLTAGSDTADLAALKPALAGVRVVGLSEASHGTHQFFTMKHRLIEFLVKGMGFTVFGIEAGYPEVLALNKYVLMGEGDAASTSRAAAAPAIC